MSDQAEILRKRREARQKKILESGESRLSKITGTSGTNAQVAPSPAVIQAREQLLKKEQEEERLKALKASGALGVPATVINGADESSSGEPAKVTSDTSAPTSPRIGRQPSVSSTTAPTAAAGVSSTTTATATESGATTTPKVSATVEDTNDADPDDSLGAPPAHTASASASSPFGTMGAGNPFMMNDPFFSSPQHQQQQQALTRMMMQQDEFGGNTSNAAAKQHQAGFGTGTPPGFTVITPQVDTTARWWKLLHFALSVIFGLGVVYAEYRRQGDLGRFDALATDRPMPYGVYQVAPMPVFWYFVTMQLILQSTRMVLHGVTASPSSTLGAIAGFLPPPFSDMIRIFMRYRLIWSSMVNDLSVIVFIVGLTIVFTHMFS
ncbi:hypothetical protein BGZ95_011020 [Linnemannia exigua]|uniref:Uncharacterized protein n=1 Tax=Linnemannia exigua TaxID=604196 RepID=A0AAD4H5Y1_9FUNG|nr:hypothetical protein BGZ95_011020 [Linnemannia exigua]